MKIARLDLAKQFLKEKSCSHLLVSEPIDVAYISGFYASTAYLLISTRHNILFTDFRYKEAAEIFCKKNPKLWRFILLDESNLKFLGRYAAGMSSLGFQSDSLSVDQYHELKRALPAVNLVRCKTSISELSTVKLPHEIAAMRHAAGIADTALATVLPQLRPGITELDVAAMLEHNCRCLGSAQTSFATIVLFGANSALPHGVPGTRRLKKGDIVLIDFGCMVDGYCSDMTRTMVMGKASTRHKELYSIVLNAQEAARRCAYSGIKATDVDRAARSIITAAGYSDYFGHGTGHGIGRRVHEQPRINKTSTSILQTGTVFSIEPGIYIPGFGGVRIEDMVVLTGRGVDVLTQSPRQLIELGI